MVYVTMCGMVFSSNQLGVKHEKECMDCKAAWGSYRENPFELDHVGEDWEDENEN